MIETHKPLIWIDQEEALNRLIDDLQQQAMIAVDTESDSLFSYFEKVCLIQISTTAIDYVLDPLALDVSPLGLVLANPAVGKIFHAAEFDVISLRRDYGFQIENLFDTMLAARILGWPKYGLGHILESHFQTKPNKRFQQYNWTTRPLDPAALAYARLDTHFLIPLYEMQVAALRKRNRLEEAKAAFNYTAKARASVKIFDPAVTWHLKGLRNVPDEKQGLLQALFVFRDNMARQLDIPAFKLFSDATLAHLVHRPPESLKHLKKTKGLNRGFVRRYGEDLLAVLAKKSAKAKPPPETKRALSEAAAQRYERLRDWRNRTAKQRQVEADIVLPNKTLKQLAKKNPKDVSELTALNLLGQWQLQTYAEAIIDELK